ncbi:hypothetical protein F4821DRAFT_8930 [Hypoxylon rubiginosum]|uniref:Uncharacterized protein n=1 Tax=Hypoxylon rubiginosum TaxID=110542 RepID=A0ACC0DME5_9PEZI|nr:hypothetical protein F4821DRAFT_8930 [Hypoxylon rubiginosum]
MLVFVLLCCRLIGYCLLRWMTKSRRLSELDYVFQGLVSIANPALFTSLPASITCLHTNLVPVGQAARYSPTSVHPKLGLVLPSARARN